MPAPKSQWKSLYNNHPSKYWVYRIRYIQEMHTFVKCPWFSEWAGLDK